jgi:hypothetical protein
MAFRLISTLNCDGSRIMCMHMIYLSQNTHPVQTNNSPYYVVFKKESLENSNPANGLKTKILPD